MDSYIIVWWGGKILCSHGEIVYYYLAGREEDIVFPWCPFGVWGSLKDVFLFLDSIQFVEEGKSHFEQVLALSYYM